MGAQSFNASSKIEKSLGVNVIVTISSFPASSDTFSNPLNILGGSAAAAGNWKV